MPSDWNRRAAPANGPLLQCHDCGQFFRPYAGCRRRVVVGEVAFWASALPSSSSFFASGTQRANVNLCPDCLVQQEEAERRAARRQRHLLLAAAVLTLVVVGLNVLLWSRF